MQGCFAARRERGERERKEVDPPLSNTLDR